MSTSLLVEGMLAVAEEQEQNVSVEALSAGEYAASIDQCDLVLIAPQIRHLRKGIEKLATASGKPVALIEPFHYATMDGRAVLDQAIQMLVNPA